VAGLAGVRSDEVFQQHLQRGLGRLRIDAIQVCHPLLQPALGEFSIRGPEALFFALACGLLYSIIKAVEFMTIETWNMRNLDQELPDALAFVPGQSVGGDKWGEDRAVFPILGFVVNSLSLVGWGRSSVGRASRSQ
jgi:hypothetical protein